MTKDLNRLSAEVITDKGMVMVRREDLKFVLTRLYDLPIRDRIQDKEIYDRLKAALKAKGVEVE